MKEMRRFGSFVLLLCTTVLPLACQPQPPSFECADAIGCIQIAPDDPIKVGVLQVLSGDLANLGLGNLRTIELVLDDRGREILAHSVELQTEDSLCSQEGGSTAAAKIAADPQNVGILGPTCSGAAASATKVVSEAGLLMISGSSTAPSLTSFGGEPGSDWRPGFLRTAQNDALSGRAAATFVSQQLRLSKAATINDGDPYTRGLTETFERAFIELGGQVVLSAGVNKGDTDMGPVLTAVARSGAEVVYLPIFEQEANHLLRQARDMEPLEEVIFLSAEGLYQETFIQAAGDASVGIYLVIPTTPESEAREAFVARYEAKYGEAPEPPYYAHTYDAASLLLDAIEAVAIQDQDGTLHIGRQDLREALYATAGYQGLSGSLTCDEYGDCGAGRFAVARLDNPAFGLEGLADNVVYTYPPGP
jgi:branched-chain amino acid transport system substrate-binding protein